MSYVLNQIYNHSGTNRPLKKSMGTYGSTKTKIKGLYTEMEKVQTFCT